MTSTKKLHIYIGCLFSPLLIYFCLSGIWQTFNLHHHHRGVPPTALQKILHTLSSPHTDDTMPGLEDQDSASLLFKIFAALMAAGFVLTAMLGIRMAFDYKKLRKTVGWLLLAGVLLPVIFLFIHN